MVRITPSLYLEEKDIPKLKRRLAELNFTGKNYIGHFLEKVMTEKLIFVTGDDIKIVFGSEAK